MIKNKTKTKFFTNIVNISSELINKVNIINNLKLLYINRSKKLLSEDNILFDDFIKKIETQDKKINEIIQKHNKLIEITENDIYCKEELFIIFNEILFCIKIIEICFNIIQYNKIIELNKFYEKTINSVIDFLNVFIINYMNNEYDFYLNLTNVDLIELFENTKKIFNLIIQHKKINITVVFNDINDCVIVGDYFLLLYAFLRIINYIINNIENNESIIINIYCKNNANGIVELNIRIDYNNNFNKIININEFKEFLYFSHKIITSHNGELNNYINLTQDIIDNNDNNDDNFEKYKNNILISLPFLNYLKVSKVKINKFLIKNNISLIPKNYVLNNLIFEKKQYFTSKKYSKDNLINNSINSSNHNLNNNIIDNSKDSTGSGSGSSSGFNNDENTFKELKVIIVDDSVVNSKFLSFLLKKHFIKDNIELAENGCEIINNFFLKKKTYNIIFMDNNMPLLSGFTTVKILRSLGFDKLIVGLTGDNINIYNNDLLNCGANIVFKKPFKKDYLELIYNFYLNNINVNYINKKIFHIYIDNIYSLSFNK